VRRQESYQIMLAAAASMQKSIAEILGAKSAEADIAGGWLRSYVQPAQFDSPEGIHKQTLELHDELIELIEGITKMKKGLVRNLRIATGADQNGLSPYGGMLGQMEE
jgi:hypothetical protein